jgi:hypothetical protein
MIPFLAFWLKRMAEGGFMHLAGSVMATANSASAAMAGEKSSGTRNWDNESIRNKNNDNVSSNKHDSSMQYVSGAARSMMSDGSMEMIRPDGKAVYFGGAGQNTSSGETRYTEGRGFSVNGEQSMRHETQAMSSETATRSTAYDKMMASEASALHSLAQSTKTDNGYNIDTSTEEGRETIKAINEIDRLNDSNDYGWKQNAEAHLRGDVDPIPAGRIAKFLSGVDVQVGGSVSAENVSSQNNEDAHSTEQSTNTTGKTGTSDRASQHSSYLESNGVDKNTQNSLRESYQEVERLDNSIAEHKSNIDSHTKTMNYAQSNSGEMSKDITQDVADHYQKINGGSAKQAHEAVSYRTDKAEEAFKDLTSANYQEKFNEIKSQGERIKSSNNVNDFADNNQIDKSIGRKRDGFAQTNNINTDIKGAEQQISKDHTEMKGKYDKSHESHSKEFVSNQSDINSKREEQQDKINKYEEDRIGRGLIATTGVQALDFVTRGRAGESIGRPAEKTNYDDELGDPIGRPYEPNVGIYNWETGKLDPLPQGKGRRLKFDQNETKGNSEYVDPKKK